MRIGLSVDISRIAFIEAGVPSAVSPTIAAYTTETVDLFEVTSHSFSYNHSGGKLLVVAVGTIRDQPGVGTPTAGTSWAYNSVSPDVGPTVITQSTETNGSPLLQYALWDSPSTGSNTLTVDWSTDGVRDLVVYCIALNDADTINSVTVASTGGAFWFNGDHTHTVTEAGTLLLSFLIGRDSVSRDTLSSSTHSVVASTVSAAATGDAAICHLATLANPGVGSQSVNLEVGSNDYINGVTIEIGLAA